MGFSINNLTLFGLVLAVGIVVDDAIVVVENVERHLEHGMSRRDAALRTMEEVGSALVSIALVLCAVFVPTAFLGGISGQFFQQFAVTIAVATAISCFCSLTLSPALASLILQPHADKRPPASWNFIARGWDWFTGLFNRGFDRLAHGYGRAANFVIRHSVVMLLVYVALIGSAGWLLVTTPQGFIPAQDRGYVIVSVQLPGAASLARTTEIVRRDRADRARHARHRSRGSVRRLLGRNPNAGEQRCSAISRVRRCGRSPQEGAVRATPSRTICAGGWPASRAPSSSSSRRLRFPASAPAAASPCGSRTVRAAAPRCWRLRPTNWSALRARHPA